MYSSAEFTICDSMSLLFTLLNNVTQGLQTGEADDFVLGGRLVAILYEIAVIQGQLSQVCHIKQGMLRF